MLTAVLAIYAAVVSTGAVVISYMSYRSGGPQLSGNAEIFGIALNRRLPVAGWPLSSPSCVLPSGIEGHSGLRWHFPAHNLVREWLNSGDLIQLEVQTGLASGGLKL
jgi:hypothetical protein